MTDHLGTVHDLAAYNAETGVTSIANHRVYDSYGNMKSQTNAAVDCLFSFTGRAYDEATGLQDNWHRKYDGGIGGWISKDPMGITAGDSNTGRYVGNSPTNGIDPSGLWTIGARKLFWGTTKPVHERIALEAAINAYGYAWDTEITDDNLLNYEQYLKHYDFARGLLTGARDVDAPNGTSGIVLTYLMDLVDMKPENYKMTEATANSHLLKNVDRHSMTTHSRSNTSIVSAKTMAENIVNWICTQYQLALDARELTAVWFPNPEYIGTKYRYKATYESGRALGQALHTLSDLYCPSHVERLADWTIMRFQDYNAQSPKAHAKGDNPDIGGYVAVCFEMAKVQCAALLKMFKAGTPVKSSEGVEGVKDWLLAGPLKLARDAQGNIVAKNGGCADGYEFSFFEIAIAEDVKEALW